ncbi:MAG: transposase [Rhodobacteraceae bacterium]|nr:transposase [Paracoccaceae bacterium]
MCDVRRGRAAAGPHAGARGERARQGIRGGERKSDPKDAVVIAELARTRPDLRAVEPPDPLDAEIRLLVSRRRELVTEQTRRAARLRDLLSGLFPALERRIDPPPAPALCFSAIMPRRGYPRRRGKAHHPPADKGRDGPARP